MVMKAGKPVCLQIGGESIIRHATVHIIRVRQVCGQCFAPPIARALHVFGVCKC